MIKRVTRQEATVFNLPGRDWLLYIGPENSPARNVSVGLSIFPPGSHPAGHVHDREEETIYVTAGHGRLVTAEATAELEAVLRIDPRNADARRALDGLQRRAAKP